MFGGPLPQLVVDAAGLAPKADTAALHAAFLCYGNLTDARVLATADRRSLQFEFVSFDNSVAAAAAAAASLHHTYLGAANLVVEYERAVREGAILCPPRLFAAQTTLADTHFCVRLLVLQAARDEATGPGVDAPQARTWQMERRRGGPAAPADGKEKATGEGFS
ncbi:hypothetical protein MMPV_006888 [Pyropia vietnamensis]